MKMMKSICKSNSELLALLSTGALHGLNGCLSKKNSFCPFLLLFRQAKSLWRWSLRCVTMKLEHCATMLAGSLVDGAEQRCFASWCWATRTPCFAKAKVLLTFKSDPFLVCCTLDFDCAHNSHTIPRVSKGPNAGDIFLLNELEQNRTCPWW